MRRISCLISRQTKAYGKTAHIARRTDTSCSWQGFSQKVVIASVSIKLV